MNRFCLGVFALLAGLLATGCSPIKYTGAITPVSGRSIFVQPAAITTCHELLDKAAVESAITSTAQELLLDSGYTIASSAEAADLVLQADVKEFDLGSQVARVIAGSGAAFHATMIQIHPKVGLDNGGYRKAEVSLNFDAFRGVEAHQQALIDEIARMHVWVADTYCK